MGGLASLSAPELGAIAIRGALDRGQIDATGVDEVIMGCVLTSGVGQAPARQAALKAGMPDAVAVLTINKVCGSGLKAVMLADQAIRAGDATCVVAGGMESMSRTPHLLAGSRAGWRIGNALMIDSMIHDGLSCATERVAMGVLADATAQQYEISRADQDAFAVESHRRAVASAAALAYEMTPVSISGRRTHTVVSADEGPRADATLETLGHLSPAFAEEASSDASAANAIAATPRTADGAPLGSTARHTVTAGNASQISDGAAALVVVSSAIAKRFATPLKARIIASATAGAAPRDLFVAPVSAVQMALRRAGLSLDEIDLVEINEAFAAQCLACMKLLDLDQAKTNVCGGAIALGHPIGASGARVLVTLLHELARRNLRRGLASLCLGGGNAVAMIVERE